ncbi:Protein LAP2, partial [Orchesella cincta]
MWKACCSCLPCCAKKDEPEDVQELDFRHCSLCEVPPDIFTYERTLEKLDLGSNQVMSYYSIMLKNISDLPPNLFHCHELRDLDLCDNDLKEIPAAIESLTRIAKLDVSRNALSEVPESIKNCKNLTYLDLSLNQLTKLPEAICQLVNLEELFLNETALEFLPANFGRLTKLRILELRENLLQTLPKSMSRLHQLQRLDIGSNDIEELPEVIGTMTSLTELWADNNCIREIPKFIGNLTKLACLDMSKNEVGEISAEIGKCTNLMDVTLTHNSLTSLPDSFTKLENAATIRIDSNCINRLPDDIGKLKSLQELSAVSNLLKAIPLSIGLLRKLHTLYLDENRLTELPIEIGSCTSLTVLSVARNNLKEIPSEVGHLSKLKMLKLTNNSIQNLPVSILGLTNLGALWLTDGQNKPLVALNREIDPGSGQHVVTCCLLPQLPAPDGDFNKNDNDEETPRRSERKIRFQNEIEPPTPEKPATNGGLLRAPTPYPKELRALAKHASHIRQAKSQNGEVINISDEPVYEGDFRESDFNGYGDLIRDPAVKDDYELKALIEKRDDLVKSNDNQEVKVNEKVGSDKNEFVKYNMLPEKHEEEKKGSWVASEVNPSMNTLGLPEVVPYNPAPYTEDLRLPQLPVGRTPPPYHIAAQRAAFFRSSGGAGSGRINFPTEPPIPNSDVLNQNAPYPNVPTGQYLVEDNDWKHETREMKQESSNMDNYPYQETLPKPTDNMAYNDTHPVQYGHFEMQSHNMEYEYSGILPDKNANITAAKTQYGADATDSANANVYSPQDRFHEDDQGNHMENANEVAVQNSRLKDMAEHRAEDVIETRIPMLSHKGNKNVTAETKVSRIPSISGSNKRQFSASAVENAQTQPLLPAHEAPAPPPAFAFKGKETGIPGAVKMGQTGIPMQYEPKITSPSKIANSAPTSRIPSKFQPEDRPPPMVDSPKRHGNPSSGNLKFSGGSGIPKISNIASPQNVGVMMPDQRKSGSRIPKSDAPRALPEDVSLPSSPTDDGRRPEIPSYLPISPEKNANRAIPSKTVRSGIPKPPTGRTPSPTGSKIPSTRKPWIFGTHKNARVVSVEHRKINQFQLGFMIDDFASQVSPPEGKGIYVTGTDTDELPVKVGDKILQVDGIDVANMGVEI